MTPGNAAQSALSLGQIGSRFFNDTVARTGNWGAIYCVTACSFTTLTSATRPDTTALMLGTLTGITLIAGQCIYGHFTAITLAGGSIIVYEL